jgi:hypothetical protein
MEEKYVSVTSGEGADSDKEAIQQTIVEIQDGLENVKNYASGSGPDTAFCGCITSIRLAPCALLASWLRGRSKWTSIPMISAPKTILHSHLVHTTLEREQQDILLKRASTCCIHRRAGRCSSS